MKKELRASSATCPNSGNVSRKRSGAGRADLTPVLKTWSMRIFIGQGARRLMPPARMTEPVSSARCRPYGRTYCSSLHSHEIVFFSVFPFGPDFTEVPLTGLRARPRARGTVSYLADSPAFARSIRWTGRQPEPFEIRLADTGGDRNTGFV